MNPLDDLNASFRGWREIVAGKPTAIERFHTNTSGFAVALLWFAVAVLLSVAVQTVAGGMPPIGQVMFTLVAQGVTVAILGILFAQTLRFLQLTTISLNTLLVPTLYALAYAVVVAVPLTLLGPNAALIAILALGFLIYKAGRVLAGMQIGIAAALALLSVIVLVVVPNALYMLLQLIPSA